MDDVDLRLIQLVGPGPFLGPARRLRDGSPTALAKALGVSVETVRRRLHALRESGVLLGRGVWPNLRLLGQTASSYHFRLPAGIRKPVAVANVAKLRGVLGVYEFVGSDLCVDLVHDNETERTALVRRVQGQLGGASATAVLDYQLPIPQRSLSRLDWRILTALREDADRDVGEVAQELRVSRRTVVRRLQAMEEDGAFDVAGLFDPSRMEGHLLAYLLIHMAKGSGASDRRAVLDTLQARWLAQWSPPDAKLAHVVVVLVARSTRDLEDVRRETESQARVQRAEAMIVHCSTPGPDWLEQAIEDRTTSAPLVVQNATRRA